ncbi:YscQ/HrcQ family type III secretion apparatus protein [Corallococcus sp. AB049A]|uniref:Flagellar motor switch protein FliM n=1 Tax=Corallococcus interemptor TaxID=2316720 RepID=A0A3A8PPX4_9BACT|nr:MULTISPECIES: FliM/FliN family flagellar motor switch protein [Corallococcus]RKH58476.1 YscQ/HrcQ family type III secretion apparatus protein [Corallococcus interemptor]RKI50834.1 YscQ/HrcQ family type III secretion apparatus protein [Corallococcus sp. AB049A]
MQTNPVRSPSIAKKPTRPFRPGARRLTRAHLVLGQRPQVGRWSAELLRDVGAALSRDLGAAVSLEGHLVPAAVHPERELAMGMVFALVELSAVGGTAIVELEVPLVFAALAKLAGTGTRPAPVAELTRLEESALVYLLLSALAAMRGQGEWVRRLGPRLSAVSMRRGEVLTRVDPGQPYVAVLLTATVEGATVGGRVLLPARAVQTAFQELPVEPGGAIASQVLAASVPARCLVGRSPLQGSAVDALAVGDVVLFEGVRLRDGRVEGPGQLITRGFALRGGFHAEGFSTGSVHSHAARQEPDMVATNKRSEAMPPLPVDVEIELTRLLLPLSELAALKPGTLLPLHVNASSPVLLRVGDRVVARAELVEIEGEVGARILALLP